MRLTVGADCGSFPEVARTRNYAASIVADGETGYVVTLGEASFLSGLICTFNPSHLGCNQFVASRTGDSLRFDLITQNDDSHGGRIVEHIPPGTWFSLQGSATGRLQDGAITAVGTASAWYCPTVTATPYPFRCLTSSLCHSNDLGLTFTRN